MSKKSEKVRHILALSGGKDSAALAVHLRGKIPDLQYVFMDTGHELPETYDFLNRMRAILGIKIEIRKPERDFKFWLDIFGGCLPSPENRWCTKLLKIMPYEQYIGDHRALSYVALRADEDRSGYVEHGPNVVPIYPFIEDGLTKADIIQILEESGLGLPGYYTWRSRSGCYFCFFQRRIEWIGLYDHHPKLFEKACGYESNHSDGRTYTWIEGKSLQLILKERDRIIEEAGTRAAPRRKGAASKRLIVGLPETNFSFGDGSILGGVSSDDELYEDDEDNDEKPCLICTH